MSNALTSTRVPGVVYLAWPIFGYVSEGICKQNERQRFPFGDLMGKGAFRYLPFVRYDLRRTPCTPSFRVSRAYEGQTVSGPGVASFHLKLRGGRWATCSDAHFLNSSNLFGCSSIPSVPIWEAATSWRLSNQDGCRLDAQASPFGEASLKPPVRR